MALSPANVLSITSQPVSTRRIIPFKKQKTKNKTQYDQDSQIKQNKFLTPEAFSSMSYTVCECASTVAMSIYYIQSVFP